MPLLVRAVAWLWMLAGFFALATILLADMLILGQKPLTETAITLAFPWSGMIDFLRLGPRLTMVLLALGVFVNGQILLTIANILDD